VCARACASTCVEIALIHHAPIFRADAIQGAIVPRDKRRNV